ncbi:MAG TPA: glycosyltransferase, partial [Candidatus Dormibacteraeota bacterium]|nr:glycosyltransferase [Candidatus Dormibacteraeota bacterium]
VALRALGHEVGVLSGGRRAADRALSRRDEEVDGVPVTSLNTEPFFGWDDPLNFNNPQAVEPVLEWLEGFHPDLVHAHSIQGLGAAWFDASSARRPLLVTMHDWWWICARQFLVTQEMEVCGPLVDGPGCPCSGGAVFNQARRRWLAERLAFADRVLVPSRFMQESLAINGFDPARVVVNENGVPHQPANSPGGSGRPAAEPGSPVRLGFVGGPHDFKGFPVLMRACALLGVLPFELRCWGAAESLEARELPAGVEILPAYPREKTTEVMSSLDALLVPSLMRESSSLVTREALALGVPVICSDSGGPEEVIRDGFNGLVVESNNEVALASALARFSGDAALRRHLRRGAAASGRTTVDLGQQTAHLAAIYDEVVAARTAPAPAVSGVGPVGPVQVDDPPALQPRIETPDTPPDMLILCGIEGAPLRYRAFHLAQAHRALGGRATCLHYRDPQALDEVRKHPLVVMYRVPWSDYVRECIQAARDAGATLVFSVDDLIFDPTLRDRIPAIKILPPADAELWMEGVQRYSVMTRVCPVFIGSTPALVEAAEKLGLKSFLVPNSLGTEVALLSQAAINASRGPRAAREAEGICRIGYLSGSITHDHDWAVVEPAIARVLARHPLAELWIVGPLQLGAAIDRAHPRMKRLGFRPYQELPRLQAELDIVLAPLEPGLEFSEAKSAVKWLESAAVGRPMIASPTGPFREVIEDGVNGMLADADQWEERLDALVSDIGLRRAIGRAARHSVYREHGPWALARHWATTWPALMAVGRDTELRPLPAQAKAEPPTPSALEPEAPAAYLDYAQGTWEIPSENLGRDRVLHSSVRAVYPRLSRIDLCTTAYRSAAPLHLRLLDGRGKVVRQGELPTGMVVENGWSSWRFDPIDDSAGALYELELTQPAGDLNHGVAVWCSLDQGTRTVDGRRVVGEMYLRAWARPTREQISQVALERRIVTPPRPRNARLRRMRLLWHKGRLAMETDGPRMTAIRTARVAQRSVMGRVRRRRRPG